VYARASIVQDRRELLERSFTNHLSNNQNLQRLFMRQKNPYSILVVVVYNAARFSTTTPYRLNFTSITLSVLFISPAETSMLVISASTDFKAWVLLSSEGFKDLKKM
jgi:hypothetical protein